MGDYPGRGGYVGMDDAQGDPDRISEDRLRDGHYRAAFVLGTSLPGDKLQYPAGDAAVRVWPEAGGGKGTGEDPDPLTAACALRFAPGEDYLFCSNAGDNSVSMYERDSETGFLELKFCLPISGDYPKDIAICPDREHLASINHGGSISLFHVDYEKSLLIMSGRTIRVNEPNCCELVKLGE